MTGQLSPNEASQRIVARIKVTPDQVSRAKALIEERAKAAEGTLWTQTLIDAVLMENSTPIPRQIFTHPTRNPEPGIQKASEAISWRMAAMEAVLSLVHSGVLLPMGGPAPVKAVAIHYDTAAVNSGGGSGGWDFKETDVWLPSQVRLAPSQVA